MGKPMARNLIKAGYQLIVHNRSRGGVDELAAAGATAGTSPADVARRSSVVITMVPDTPDVEAVLTGADGVLSALQPNAVVIDMSSISPVATKRLAARVAERGAHMLDAPVSGGEIGAINATLSIMVGGDEPTFARVQPILAAMGNPERIVYIGDRAPGRPARSAIRSQSAARSPASARRSRSPERRRRRGARPPGAARRIRVEQSARRPRRAHAHGQLQAGFQSASLSEGSAARERSRVVQQRGHASDGTRRAADERAHRVRRGRISIMRRSGRCCLDPPDCRDASHEGTKHREADRISSRTNVFVFVAFASSWLAGAD